MSPNITLNRLPGIVPIIASALDLEGCTLPADRALDKPRGRARPGPSAPGLKILRNCFPNTVARTLTVSVTAYLRELGIAHWKAWCSLFATKEICSTCIFLI